MAFSQSFEFGNSTFMNIENQVNIAIVKNDNQPLDVIQESPTKNNKCHHTTIFSHSRARLIGNGTKKHFRKSKSDSKLPRVSQQQSGENYSEFFRSEFTFSIKEPKDELDSLKKGESFVSLSQIEAKFDEQTNKVKNEYDEAKFEEQTDKENNECDDLEAPIFSEDIKTAIDASQEWGDSIPITHETNKTFKDSIKDDIVEDIVQLDECSFLCPVRDKSDVIQLTEELQKTYAEIGGERDECYRSKAYACDQSVRNTTSEQLKLSTMPLKSSVDKVEVSNTEKHLSVQKMQLKIKEDDVESLKSISAWNLPNSILTEYAKKGVQNMFDWQVKCLSNPKVLFEHSNLVYSAPTSAGKTLVSEILLLKTVLERQKKVLMILPFISVVREKMFYLQDLLTPAGYRVEGFFGGYTPPGGFESINVAICTIEKANSIVNKLLEQGKIYDIGTVIVDEVHLISDPGRGYILELLLAKILYISRKYMINIQVVTMSATLANVQLLQTWLEAEIFITDFRPVELREMIKVGNKIYDANMQLIRDVSHDFPQLPNDSDHIAQLCIETILEDCSVIVFCPSKDWCENLAVQLAGAIHALGKSGSKIGIRLRSKLNRESIDEMKKQLRDIPTGLDAVLEKTVTFACAFHHAGLTTEERDIIESCFKSGALKVIVATSTLSSGVNLPARRVLIRSPLFGGKQMSSLTYRQMIGRAGRTGKDTLGESILICTESNARIGRELVTAAIRPIYSCLEMDSSSHLKRALLEVISAGVVSSREDIECFFSCTLLSAQKKLSDNMNKLEDKSLEPKGSFINEALDFLIEYEFIRLQKNEETEVEIYAPTRLGNACLASSMPPTDGLILFSELQKARRCFVLESELHAVYLVTPYSVCYQIHELDWLLFLDLWEKLTPAMKKVGELVGVKESFLVRAMRGQTKLDYKLMQIHKRFYTALALQELVNETPINAVASKYKCNRGMLQGLQQMASTFAGIVTAFCNSLQWATLSLVVSQFKERLYFGIHRDLIDLMRIPDLTQKRARCLFDAGITTLVELANTDVLTVEKILYNSLSFDSEKQHENEDAHDAEQRKLVRNFFITGRAGITVPAAAKMLVTEARQFVQYEIGVQNIKWTQEKVHKSPGTTDSDELHMSCEEAHTDMPKRKLSNIEDKAGTPPKTVKLDKVDTFLQVQKCGGNEKTEDKTPHKHTELLISKKQTNKDQNKLQSNVEVKVVLTDDRITDKTNLAKTKSNQEHKSVESLKTVVSNHLRRKTLSNENRTNESKAASPVPNQNEVAPMKSLTSYAVKSLPAVAIAPENETIEKPTTSKDARKLLLQEKRKQALILKNKRITQIESNKEQLLNTHSDNNLIGQEKCVEKNKENTKPSLENTSHSAQCLRDTPKKTEINSKSTKKSSPFVTPIPRRSTEPQYKKEQTPKSDSLPRRSPRNHTKSSATTATPEQNRNTDELFMEESFEMNSEIKNALAEAENENKSFDEIPGSQQLPSVTTETARTPHSSRFLRANRTQKTVASPKLQPSVKKEPAPSHSSVSIELSDISLENSLIKNPLLLNASHILSCSKIDTDASSFKCIEIIDICGDQQLFKGAFKEIVAAKRFGVSIGLQQQSAKRKPLIGGKLLINQAAANDEAKNYVKPLFVVDDLAYIEGIAFCLTENIVYYMNMQEAGTCKGLTAEIKCKYLRMLLKSAEYTLIMFDAKEQLKVLHLAIPNLGELSMNIEDPKVANWLLQPDTVANMHYLAQQFAPECTALVNLCGRGRGYNSFGLDHQSAILAKVRCSIEACVTIHILKGQVENLERIGNGQLHKFFVELEMPLQLSLCNMELYGFPVNEQAMQELYRTMVSTMKKLESKIYEMHGARFNLGSSSAVARVLGLHRKSNGRISTSRQILEKLDTPISQMIINYRKLSVTLTKNIQPLLKCIKTARIHGQSITFTSTGRISMIDPNLQNVAKDFEVEIGNEKLTISCRSVFYPIDERRCLISADFCQLEMRILSHLSQDSALLQVMKSEQDVFTAIAARWNKIAEDNVSEQLRNGTKQICYGIVYGMGMRSLAESLKCTEQEASMVSEQFHAAYPGIKVYADKVVKFARNNGYIETITGRRRYLEHINSAEHNMKAQAERQAINSTIQGSAADIAKSAILRMEKNIFKYREKLGLKVNCVRLILHLHDELIFEVPAEKAKKIAKVLSVTMENCVKLNVPLKVKLKMGKSWGELKDIKI